jgi:hypothetical protein|tara:strand:+ start:216 stop:596 length:381 start_codon:yes stop_codon:yes gene_type:complete
MSERNRMLSEQQEVFLDNLFGACQGDFRASLRAAGYAETESSSRVTRSLKAEIIERAELLLAQNAPKAVLSMSGILDTPSALGNRDKLAAAKEILDRAGLVKTEKVEHVGNVSSIVLLPPLDMDED